MHWAAPAPRDERGRYESRVRAVLRQLLEWHAQGKIRPFAGEVYPLERFAEAQDALLARRTVGKVVLRIAK